MTFETRTEDDISAALDAGSEAGSTAGPLPILVIMHGEASSAGRIGQELARRGHAVDICKPRFGGVLPKTLANHAGVVVFGGPMSCNDADPYLKDEIDFVGVALKEQKPFLGVCLGAQMLAKHLGAGVRKHPGGTVEIGYGSVRPTAQGRHLGPWPDQVYQWHREGFEMPAGGVRLAEGSVFENQAFAYGRNALGVQFHPEITYTLVNRWTTMAKDWKDCDGAQERSAQLASHLLHAAAVDKWLRSAIDHWLNAGVHTAA
jgi:GMP synthase (glutamine-hydrolysing)